MKQLAWLFLLLGICLPIYAGPEYRAGQTPSTVHSLLHGEVSADYQWTSHQMELVTHEGSTSKLEGWNVRALWTPVSWLSVGAEMTQFNEEDLKDFFVSAYKTQRVGGLVKFTLSPNTSPRVYVVGGYGRTTHQLDYVHSFIRTRTWPNHDKKNIPYWLIGLGLEVDVWRNLFVGVEGNLTHHQSTKLVHYYKTDSNKETTVRVRAGVRF